VTGKKPVPPSAERIVDRMDRLDLETLVLTIHQTLDGAEWDSGTASTIANILTDAGFTIREPEEDSE
jgi:hypothetical protein